MKNALLFSFSFEGHRQVYVQHFIEALLRKGYQVHLVVDLSEAKKNFPCIAPYRAHPYVRFEYIPNALRVSLSSFRKLQDKLSADLTILLEADNHIHILTRQLLPKAPRLRGKNIGIFIRGTNYVYFQNQPLSLSNGFRLIKHFFRTWDSNPYIFHAFTLPMFDLLDVALVIDERFVLSVTYPHRWIPDMIFPLLSDEPSQVQTEYQHWAPQLTRFLDDNHGREVLLYFGDARQRRGYDSLLKLARDENCCFVHCGLFHADEKYDENIEELKNELRFRGLLFETNVFIENYSTIQLFFDACNYMILPYSDHFGSSGVMLQAIHFGKPVLVPDQGLMAYRTRHAGLGLTYRPKDYQDLQIQWKCLIDTLPDYLENLAEFKKKFTQEKSQQALDDILNSVIG